MEQVVGFALFERAHGRLRPTMAALTLFDDVRLAYVGLNVSPQPRAPARVS